MPMVTPRLSRAESGGPKKTNPSSAQTKIVASRGGNPLSPLPQLINCVRNVLENTPASVGPLKHVAHSANALPGVAKSSSKRKVKTSQVRVVARVRPLSAAELELGCTESVIPIIPSEGAESADSMFASPKASKAPSTFITPKIANTSTTSYAKVATPVPETAMPSRALAESVSLVVGNNPTEQKQFDYDAVFSADTSQEVVYQTSVGESVKRNIFRGCNTTIFAYGQTGTGKTYTMDGPSPVENTSSDPNDDEGIIPRAIYDLFGSKEFHQGESKIHMTYIEIYNDSIRDLLGPDDESSENMQLENEGDSVAVKKISSIEVKTAVDAKELLALASTHRVTGGSGSHARSSRSHAICTFNVSTKHGRAKRSKAKLTLVDLAGSETGSEGQSQKESIAINRDLFVLNKVLSALSDRAKHGRRKSVTHIPYRDCKLTRILRDSLGGNCYTVMIACISPNNINMKESVNTLRYAQRAKQIINTVKPNVVSRSRASESIAIKRENDIMKKQVADLMKRLGELKESVAMREVLFPDEVTDENEENKSQTENTVPCNENGNVPSTEVNTKQEDSDSTNPCFFDAFNLKDGVYDDFQSKDTFEESSICNFSAASSITMLDDSYCDTLDMDVTEKKEVLQRLEEESSQMHKHLEVMADQLEEALKRLREATLQKADIEDGVKEMEVTKQRIKIEIDTLRNQIRVLTDERKELLEDVEEEQELVQVISLLNGEQDARRKAEEELIKAQGEVASSSAERDVLRNKVGEIEAEVDKLKSQLKAMAEENKNLKKELSFNASEKEKSVDLVPPAEILKAEATKSEQRAIRQHANKLLFWANKSVEENHSFSDISTILDSADTSVASGNSRMSKFSISKLTRKGKSRDKRKGKDKKMFKQLPPLPKAATVKSSQPKETIDGPCASDTSLSGLPDEVCTCSNVFGRNKDEMEFFLPRLTNSLCTCGKMAKEDESRIGEPSSLENILHSWQTNFLSTVGILDVEELSSVEDDRRHAIAKAMKAFRRVHYPKMPVKTKACAVALHVWIKTAKVYKKTVDEFDEKTSLPMPNFLDISFASRDDSISTIGCRSFQSLA